MYSLSLPFPSSFSKTPMTTASGVPTFTSVGGVMGSSQGQPNSILRVIIENMIYPITIDVLHQVRERKREGGREGGVEDKVI